MLNRTIYSGLSYLLAPLAVARLYYLSGKHQGYRQNIDHRFGFIDSTSLVGNEFSKVLWLHAVSVGEVIASEPFVKELLVRYPNLRICLTTMTPTGAEQVGRSFADAVQNPRIEHLYAPYDLPGAVDRFLDRLKPCGLVIMETELWPNWIARAAKRGLPSILINGRMSEKSAQGYKKLGTLSKEMFGALGSIGAQTEKDAVRFRKLGSKNVVVTGNLKADFELSAQERETTAELAGILSLQNSSQVLIAASTHDGEDAIILDAFAQLLKSRSGLRLLLVPRHPNRTNDIVDIAKERSIGFRLRSNGANREETKLDDEHPLVICDQLGELRSLYGLAQIAILGGTLVDHGGHNPLEPAAWSLPLIAGPSQRNFDLAFDMLEEFGAMSRVEPSALSLFKEITNLLDNVSVAKSMGNAAFSYLHQSRGATEANLKLFGGLIGL